MKDRLPALDGLRGFAALSVVLGHVGLSSLGANSFPLIAVILTSLSAAHNAVQILFVLSGFLMAFLYPVIPDAIGFIKKRYARIFPIYGTIVIFLWIRSIESRISTWYLQVLLLFFIALCVSISWKLLKKYSRLRNIGSLIFYLFVSFQTIILFFNLFITPHFLVSGWLVMPEPQKNILIMLTNLTLTTQFVRGIQSSSGVFWSLGSEMLFYILYPFIVITLVRIARKGGIIVSIFIILAITKILLDLDNALMSVASLNGMNIARANGFVAGVTIGTIYQLKGKTWEAIQKIAGHPIFGLIALLLLILVQLGENIVGLGSIGFMNIFYLITSWLIGLVILNAIIPGSITYKIFSAKIIMFLGLISYSLYLVHNEVLPWASAISGVFLPLVASQKIVGIINVVIFLLLSIGLSFFLFKTVEFLYFASKKKITKVAQASFDEKNRDTDRGYSFGAYSLIIAITIIALSLIYSGMYSPTLLVGRHSFRDSELTPNKEVSLIGRKYEIPFIAKENNLSVLGFDLRYERSAGLTIANDKNPSTLKFELLDDKHHLLFSSIRHSYIIEGSPRFQFGFPTIKDSRDKRYSVRLSLLNGKTDDLILVDTSPNSFISIYTVERTTLLHNPSIFLINRLTFILSNMNFIFSILFILVLVPISSKNWSLSRVKIQAGKIRL